MAETVGELIQNGKDISITLTDIERDRLVVCEDVIENTYKAAFEFAGALTEIRDKKLFRESHKTFEAYCKERWDISRGRAYQKISSYETISLLESKMCTIVDISDVATDETIDICTSCEFKRSMGNRKYKGVKIPGIGQGKCIREGGLCEKKTSKPEPATSPQIILPKNEYQTRPLRKLKPEDQLKAWGLVVQTLNENPKAKLTAALIGKKAKEVSGETAKKKVKQIKKEVNSKSRLSKNFKYAHQTMLEVIEGEKNSNFATCKQSEMVKWLEALVEIAKSDD